MGDTPPKLRPRLSPSETELNKQDHMFMEEESINKIRTRSIILIHTRYSSKHSPHITDLEISKEKSQIEVHRKS